MIRLSTSIMDIQIDALQIAYHTCHFVLKQR